MGQLIARCRAPPETSEHPQPQLQVTQPTHEKKRFNPFFQSSFQTDREVNLFERYKFISNYDDRFMGRCTVLQELQTGSLFLAKDTQYKSDVQCREKVQRLRNKKQNQQHNQGLLRIIQVFGKRVDGLLTNTCKVTAIMEYPLLSLKREFNHRSLNKVDFDTNEIADVVFSTIRAYAFLEREGCNNDKIRMAHIFIGVQSKTKESKVKVIDSDLLQIDSNYHCMLKKGYESPQNHDVYLAPQEFSTLMEKKQQPPTNQRQKAGVFSLGAIILDLCVMSSSSEIYHYSDKYMKPQDVKGLINIARKRHGLLLYKLLTQMLNFQPHKRPSFSELEILISKPLGQSQAGSALRLSIVKDQNSKYLQATRHSSGTYGKVSQASVMSISMADREFCKGGEYEQYEEEELVHMHEVYTNGSQYIGQKKSDLKHGKGKYIFHDRSYYQGWWKDDMMHGEGQLFFPNGKVQYQGEWANDQPNGWGVLYAPTDPNRPSIWTRYEGEMRNGEMHGRGKVFFIDNTIFEGELQNGKVFGRGCRINPNGDIIQKQWHLTNLHSFLNEEEDHPPSIVRLSANSREF